MNVMLGIPFLRVMVKRRRDKVIRRNKEITAHYCGRKQIICFLLKKTFKNATKSSLATLTASVDGVPDLPTRNFPRPEELSRNFPRDDASSMPDYFWS